MGKVDFLKKYNQILEYTNASDAFVAEDDEGVNGNDMPQDNGNDGMGNEPNGGAPMGNNAPMGGDDAPMDDSEMPSDNGGEAVDGFNPEGADNQQGLEGMGGDQNQQGIEGMEDDQNQIQSDDEVIDVDDLTKSQESSEKKIDAMNSKFEKLMSAVDTLIKQNKEREAKSAEMISNLESEMEKRNPTPMQRMSMRTAKSGPYSMTPDEYMNNYAPDNYSAEDDNNGADDPQYKITKDDIDRFTDYGSIAKDLDIEHQGLKDILDF